MFGSGRCRSRSPLPPPLEPRWQAKWWSTRWRCRARGWWAAGWRARARPAERPSPAPRFAVARGDPAGRRRGRGPAHRAPRAEPRCDRSWRVGHPPRRPPYCLGYGPSSDVGGPDWLTGYLTASGQHHPAEVGTHEVVTRGEEHVPHVIASEGDAGHEPGGHRDDFVQTPVGVESRHGGTLPESHPHSALRIDSQSVRRSAGGAGKLAHGGPISF